MSSLLIKSLFFNISAYTKNITIFEDITPHIVFNERLQMIIRIAAVTFLSMVNGQTIPETGFVGIILTRRHVAFPSNLITFFLANS
jgi:hypothetical protein